MGVASEVATPYMCFFIIYKMRYILSKYIFATIKQIANKPVGLILSGRTGNNIYVSSETYQNLLSGNLDKIKDGTIDTLIKHKILVPNTENEFDSVNKENKEILSKFKSNTLYISLQPTATCQLSCTYCGQRHSNKHMTPTLIQSILKRVSQKLSKGDFSSLRIGWFGGEPLCSLKNMRILNQGLKKIANDYHMLYKGGITTNGYLLTPILYQELKDDFSIDKIEITLDGDRMHHDVHRQTCDGRGSFDRIFNNLLSIVTAEQYNKEKCLMSVRCNVDENNINGVLPLLKLFVEKGIQDKISFYTASVVSWAHNGAGSIEGHRHLGQVSTEIISYMINNGFTTEILPHRCPPFTCLGTDTNAEMYDADGNILDCTETSYSDYYLEKGLVLGNVTNNNSSSIHRSKISNIPSMLLNGEIKTCIDCKFYPLCGGMCPLALMEGTPRCPIFIHNLEDRMVLDFIIKMR